MSILSLSHSPFSQAMDYFPSDVSLWHIINASLVDVRVLIDDRDRVINRIIVQLRLVIKQVQLKLCGLLNRAGQLICEPMRAALEWIECRVQLLNLEAKVLSHCQATITRSQHWCAI